MENKNTVQFRTIIKTSGKRQSQQSTTHTAQPQKQEQQSIKDFFRQDTVQEAKSQSKTPTTQIPKVKTV